jgi:hypothetical protein
LQNAKPLIQEGKAIEKDKNTNSFFLVQRWCYLMRYIVYIYPNDFVRVKGWGVLNRTNLEIRFDVEEAA